MKPKIIVVTDYIEGQPVAASIRYSGLMEYIAENYTVYTFNDIKYGSAPSQYATENYKYKTPDSRFTQSIQAGTKLGLDSRRGWLEQILRTKWVISIWRNYKYSGFTFKRLNPDLFTQMNRLLRTEDIRAVFVTVPDIYGLFVMDYIHRIAPHIPKIIEIRDIINHNIGDGNPKFAFRRAEHMISRLADEIVAVTRGIYQHYEQQNTNRNIHLIKNGYDEQIFRNCTYHSMDTKKKHIIVSHIGSIYKGRSIGAFIEGLLLFYQHTGVCITFNIVGVLDQQAQDELKSVDIRDAGVNIRVIGSVAHTVAASYLKETDIAVILTHKKGSEYAIPGKTFEYIGACKPILAVTEDPELYTLIHQKYGECCRHDVIDIANGLHRIMAHEYDFSDRLQYSREFQALQIMQIIDQKIMSKRA
jgi:glycosyltransferase involved in cell wall biosynthesis